ncbi:MAG TPA: DUF1080 domain-containing protein [Bryobacteraceae bacterium]|nr:DUF1080 domain-containing protein [Bryobacteraceae bacterium]
MKTAFALAALAGVAIFASFAQQTYPVPAANDDAGYESIFDGKTLKGWDGDPHYWRVEDGALVGEITPQNLLKQNTFIIWQGGQPRDFELKVEYRISAHGNSGINYRSTRLPDQPLAMRGYQFDIDGENRNANGVRYTAQNYEERGRTFLALRGQMTQIVSGQKPQIIGSLGDTKQLESFIKNGDWNECHLIIRGNMLIHILNGHVMSMVIDDDAANRRLDGLIGVQVHVGPPMKVEYRNFRLKRLPESTSAARTLPILAIQPLPAGQ